MKRALLWCMSCCIVNAYASTTRADEISSVRVGGGATLGPDLVAWDVGYGAAWDAYIDRFGVRSGATLGMLSYPEVDATPAFLTLTPELGVFFGIEKDFRIYYTLELPARLLALQLQKTRAWYEAWWLGTRIGVELENRVRSANLRVRGGLFFAVMRNETGSVHPGASLRLVIEYGAPSLPPPPKLAKDRLCPDGTPILPGLPCP